MILKILSYNLHKGFTFTNREFVLEEIRRALRETDADIVFLQEVVGFHLDKKHEISEWETTVQFEYLADSVWHHYAYGKNAVYNKGHHGNAILSKFPISSWENYSITTNRFEKRGLIKAHVLMPDGNEIVVANTHLDLLQKGRDIQVESLIKYMKIDNKKQWILVGDFNDWNNKATKIIEKKLGAREIFTFLNGKSPLTFPSFFPVLSLDRVFSHGIKPTFAKALTGGRWRKMSDHLPLYVELEY